MAIKGEGYIKTTWAFQERPVASAKLNLWDDRIEAALELAYFLLSLAWGGGDGVIRGATTDDLDVVATAPPGMTVEVEPGYAFISGSPYKLGEKAGTVAVEAPAANPRIDLVQARLDTWDIGVKTGTEAASPTAPSADSHCVSLGELYLRVGMSCIKDTDDGMNGYITDARTFL